MTNDHVIHKFNFEIRGIRKNKEFHHLADRLSAIVRSSLKDRLQRLFDNYSIKGYHIVIRKMHVDIGLISTSNLENSILQKIEQNIETYLTSVKKQVQYKISTDQIQYSNDNISGYQTDISSIYSPDNLINPNSRLSKPQNIVVLKAKNRYLEAIMYFLEYGWLPRHLRLASKDFESVFSSLILENQAQILAHFGRKPEKTKIQALDRLSYHMKLEQLNPKTSRPKNKKVLQIIDGEKMSIITKALLNASFLNAQGKKQLIRTLSLYETSFHDLNQLSQVLLENKKLLKALDIGNSKVSQQKHIDQTAANSGDNTSKSPDTVSDIVHRSITKSSLTNTTLKHEVSSILEKHHQDSSTRSTYKPSNFESFKSQREIFEEQMAELLDSKNKSAFNKLLKSPFVKTIGDTIQYVDGRSEMYSEALLSLILNPLQRGTIFQNQPEYLKSEKEIIHQIHQDNPAIIPEVLHFLGKQNTRNIAEILSNFLDRILKRHVDNILLAVLINFSQIRTSLNKINKHISVIVKPQNLGGNTDFQEILDVLRISPFSDTQYKQLATSMQWEEFTSPTAQKLIKILKEAPFDQQQYKKLNDYMTEMSKIPNEADKFTKLVLELPKITFSSTVRTELDRKPLSLATDDQKAKKIQEKIDKTIDMKVLRDVASRVSNTKTIQTYLIYEYVLSKKDFAARVKEIVNVCLEYINYVKDLEQTKKEKKRLLKLKTKIYSSSAVISLLVQNVVADSKRMAKSDFTSSLLKIQHLMTENRLPLSQKNFLPIELSKLVKSISTQSKITDKVLKKYPSIVEKIDDLPKNVVEFVTANTQQSDDKIWNYILMQRQKQFLESHEQQFSKIQVIAKRLIENLTLLSKNKTKSELKKELKKIVSPTQYAILLPLLDESPLTIIDENTLTKLADELENIQRKILQTRASQEVKSLKSDIADLVKDEKLTNTNLSQLIKRVEKSKKLNNKKQLLATFDQGKVLKNRVLRQLNESDFKKLLASILPTDAYRRFISYKQKYDFLWKTGVDDKQIQLIFLSLAQKHKNVNEKTVFAYFFNALQKYKGWTNDFQYKRVVERYEIHKDKLTEVDRELVVNYIDHLPTLDSLAYKETRQKLADGVPVKNAGLVLLWPFMKTLFGLTNLLDSKGDFIDIAARERATLLLQYLAVKSSNIEEPYLALNKILTGYPLEESIKSEIVLTEKERDISDALLMNVIRQWPSFQNSSPDNLRGSFIIRDGILSYRNNQWILSVESKAYDLLLGKLPWGYSLIRLSWLPYMIKVEWN